MTDLMIVSDIAGRVVRGAPGVKITGASVVFDQHRLSEVRNALPPDLPKWGACTREQAGSVVNAIAAHSLGACAITWNLDTIEWNRFWIDSEILRTAITADDGEPAGFMRAAMVARYELFSSTVAISSARAAGRAGQTQGADSQGFKVFRQNLVFDTDIAGAEAIEFFVGLWKQPHERPLTASLGIKFVTVDATLKTEQDEPLLLVPDYLAGLQHCALAEAGNKFPMSKVDATILLSKFNGDDRILFTARDFDTDFREIVPTIHYLDNS